MKFTPDDPRLTRYLLGELNPKEAEALEDAMVKNPELRAALMNLRDAQNFLSSHLTILENRLSPAQRQHILSTARSLPPPPEVSTMTKKMDLRPFLLPVAAAALFVVVVSMKRPQAPSRSVPATTANAPQVTQPTATAAAAPAPPKPKSLSLELRSGIARESPIIALPVQVGNASFDLVSQSIRQARVLPPMSAVRLEEMLNHYTYRLHGVTAIARSASTSWHPDQRVSTVPPLTATLSSELIACPWKPSSTLLILSLKGNAKSSVEVKLNYVANPATVSSYHLLGFDPIIDQAATPPTSRLSPDSENTLVLEIESNTAGTELGLIEWSTDGKTAPTLSLTRKADAEPSDDARFAALVCTYSRWLAGQHTAFIDAELVAALAREVDATGLSSDREDFLSLVDQTLNLSSKE
jgi:von Willebrand factor